MSMQRDDVPPVSESAGDASVDAQAAGRGCESAPGIANLGREADVWIVPEFKVVYVATAKNACTTLKWAIAELAREDLENFSSGLKPYVDDELAVHNRDCFRNALHPVDVDRAVAQQIHPDSGWFVFGVVRDPRSRLFSAWQDKLLLHEPGFRWARDEPWFPGPACDVESIVSEFARFVDLAVASENSRLLGNDHFRSQVSTLFPDVVPYSRIYPIEQMGQLRTDLISHVEALGWSGGLEFRRSNNNPLPANARAFAGGVREKVEAMYAADFEAFGDRWDFSRIQSAPDWTPDQLHEVQVRAALGRRLGDVRQIALEHRRDAGQARQQVQKLQGERTKLETQLRKQGNRLAEAEGRLDEQADWLAKQAVRIDEQAARLAAVEQEVRRAVGEQERIAARVRGQGSTTRFGP